MKIPKGMTEQQVLDAIEKIANKLATQFKFGYYDKDDIKQEIYIIALEGIDRYDESRPLENFLFIHIRNRLITFKRDNYVRKGNICTYCENKDPECEYCFKKGLKRKTKQFLIEPLDISSINHENESNMYNTNEILDSMSIIETINIIDKNLAVSYRGDYLKMKSGIYISKQRRDEIEVEINRILLENGHEIG